MQGKRLRRKTGDDKLFALGKNAGEDEEPARNHSCQSAAPLIFTSASARIFATTSEYSPVTSASGISRSGKNSVDAVDGGVLGRHGNCYRVNIYCDNPGGAEKGSGYAEHPGTAADIKDRPHPGPGPALYR